MARKLDLSVGLVFPPKWLVSSNIWVFYDNFSVKWPGPTMYDFHDSTDTLKFWTEKRAINKTFLLSMCTTISPSFIKLDEKQKSFINSPFFCSEFRSISSIMKIVHSARGLGPKIFFQSCLIYTRLNDCLTDYSDLADNKHFKWKWAKKKFLIFLL